MGHWSSSLALPDSRHIATPPQFSGVHLGHANSKLAEIVASHWGLVFRDWTADSRLVVAPGILAGPRVGETNKKQAMASSIVAGRFWFDAFISGRDCAARFVSLVVSIRKLF
jgi:hypothetical protein